MLDFTIPSVLRMNDLDRIAPPGTSARTTLESLDLEALPRHVAVIMDGNGRWARRRGRPRLDGHRAGARAVRSTVETAGRLGIQVLTLYAFSTENWKRPPREVNGLFSLLKDFVTRELNSFRDNNLRFRPIGDLSRLDTSVRNHLDRAVAETAECTGTLVQIALNYSGRHEITRMVRDAVAAARRGELAPDEVTEPWIDDHLDTAGTPDPDLMIRTSGEQRISNFLLWQLAYAEIVFTDVLWPDFDTEEFLRALAVYQRRDRRFGGLTEGGPSVSP
jgi:undecaprenyl diphosphate synthase